MNNIKYYRGYVKILLTSKQRKEIKQIEEDLGRELTSAEIEEKFPKQERYNENGYKIAITNEARFRNYSPILTFELERDLYRAFIFDMYEVPVAVATVDKKIILISEDIESEENLKIFYEEGSRIIKNIIELEVVMNRKNRK